MRCKPCRVTHKGLRYSISVEGTVRRTWFEEGMKNGQMVQVPAYGDAEGPELSQEVRREAQRQRRNRNARERHEARTSLGLKRNRDGSYE